MKRRILLVDDEVPVLLTMKAVLEISGFDVDTAASAREGKAKLRKSEYHMIITDMRMESDASGAEVIREARAAKYHPAVALLTAFPLEDDAWQEMGADRMLVKPMQTRLLLKQIDQLFASHEAKLARLNASAPSKAGAASPKKVSAPGKENEKSPDRKAATEGKAAVVKITTGKKKPAVKKLAATRA